MAVIFILTDSIFDSHLFWSNQDALKLVKSLKAFLYLNRKAVVKEKRLTQLAITCSKLTIKTPEQRQWRRSGVFIVNLEYIPPLNLVVLLSNLSR